ncbi:MAG: cupin domain-containing protein [Pseudomonadota bacterium]
MSGFPQLIDFAGPCPAPQEWRPPAERILGGDPLQRAWNYYTSADGRFSAGIWQCAVGKWRVVFSESEFCTLLAGEILVTGDDGSERLLRAGDAFVSPAGFTGTWDVRAAARKYYVIYE